MRDREGAFILCFDSLWLKYSRLPLSHAFFPFFTYSVHGESSTGKDHCRWKRRRKKTDTRRKKRKSLSKVLLLQFLACRRAEEHKTRTSEQKSASDVKTFAVITFFQCNQEATGKYCYEFIPWRERLLFVRIASPKKCECDNVIYGCQIIPFYHLTSIALYSKARYFCVLFGKSLTF